ncbi:hypothetical protein QBC46DRAFT_131429 [Diplogelasinospora grovesii]|uniref:Uncharacterized protein n=1 Tax=Diplogelasinospora grovesii TaxID=303347 RepID=A0AAN6NH38_9PEZI|nr:hypothetical protein QBC46DRAFT_131429 [Diplogelasinospora grovesii]
MHSKPGLLRPPKKGGQHDQNTESPPHPNQQADIYHDDFACHNPRPRTLQPTRDPGMMHSLTPTSSFTVSTTTSTTSSTTSPSITPDPSVNDITVTDTTGSFVLYPHINGDLFLASTDGTTTFLPFLANLDSSTVITSRRLLYYYPSEVAASISYH